MKRKLFQLSTSSFTIASSDYFIWDKSLWSALNLKATSYNFDLCMIRGRVFAYSRYLRLQYILCTTKLNTMISKVAENEGVFNSFKNFETSLSSYPYLIVFRHYINRVSRLRILQSNGNISRVRFDLYSCGSWVVNFNRLISTHKLTWKYQNVSLTIRCRFCQNTRIKEKRT